MLFWRPLRRKVWVIFFSLIRIFMIPFILRGQRELRWNQLQCLMNNLKPRWENTNLYLLTIVFQSKLNQSKQMTFNNQAQKAKAYFQKKYLCWKKLLAACIFFILFLFEALFFSLGLIGFLLILGIVLNLLSSVSVHFRHIWCFFLLFQFVFLFCCCNMVLLLVSFLSDKCF